MSVMNARDIMNMSEEQVWSLYLKYEPDQLVKHVFDDGLEMNTTIPNTIVSYYLWELHRLYPNTPLLSKHHLAYRPFDGKAITSGLDRIVTDLRKAYTDIDYMTLGKQIYDIINNIYNMVVTRLSAFVDTLDAHDFIEIIYHPKMVELRQAFEEDDSNNAVSRFYDNIVELTKDPTFLPDNGIVQDLRMGLSSKGQLLQCIGARGRVTDINSDLFPEAIRSSFASGLIDMADFAIESRSASKALLFQKDPIRDTEYYNRRLQLLNQVVSVLHPGDCGSTETIDWYVQPGDDKLLVGKNYIKEDGTLAYIEPGTNETRSLVGKVIKLRTALYCKHTGNYGVCQTCMGQMAVTIPPMSNIGHVAAYMMGERITQTVLSVKHLDNNATVKEIILDKHDLQFVRVSETKSEQIKFHKRLEDMDVTILFPIESVGNITQALEMDNLNSLSIYKVSKLYKIGVRIRSGDTEVVEYVSVSNPSRPSSLTTHFLQHIKRTQYYQTDAKFIEVPLKGWDFGLPAFQLPQKQINMLDFMRQLSKMLECGPKESIKKGLDPMNKEDITTYLFKLLDFSSEYIHIPLMYLEITVLASLIRSAKENDYRIVSNDSNREFASSPQALQNRSLSCALAFKEQAKVLISTQAFNRTNRVGHPFDNLFVQNPDDAFFDHWESVYVPESVKQQQNK
nr:MAG TPA: DNA-directed RNA polymerase subunit beta' [Caudoviricetes sp.]